uniref:Uncharacterized protein n=1 Tax=Anguilla anguilla TaxID=7936 RepID=A0A0E9WS73_ANGAN
MLLAKNRKNKNKKITTNKKNLYFETYLQLAQVGSTASQNGALREFSTAGSPDPFFLFYRLFQTGFWFSLPLSILLKSAFSFQQRSERVVQNGSCDRYLLNLYYAKSALIGPDKPDYHGEG